MRRETLILATLLVTSGVGPITATSTAATDTVSAPEDPSSLGDTVADLERGRLSDAVARQVGDVDRFDPSPPPADAAEALVRLSHGQLDGERAGTVLADVPPSVSPAVERLLVGIARSQAIVDEQLDRAGIEDPAQARTEVLSGEPRAASLDPSTSGQAPTQPTSLAERYPKVQSSAFLAAQAILLDAIEDARAHLEGLSTQPAADESCEVYEPPYLVVCSEGPNTYGPEDDAILIVDLGGDDDYDNAQGAPFETQDTPSPTGTLLLPQVIVDVFGNDEYVAEVSDDAGLQQLVVQGAAVLGVGGLVDLGGEDVYRARADVQPAQNVVDSRVIAQGAGVVGVGVLIDAAFIECMEAEAIGRGDQAHLWAQGTGELGAGLVAIPSPIEPPCDGSMPRAVASTTPTTVGDRLRFGSARVVAQGAGQDGAGILVGGAPFDEDYEAIARGGATTVIAQGASATTLEVFGVSTRALGLLVDPSGGDAFHAAAETTGTLTTWRLGGSSASATADLTVGGADLVAQGATRGGIAALADGGPGVGDLVAHASIDAEAFALAQATLDGGTATATASVDTGTAHAMAHGAAQDGLAVVGGLNAPPVVGAVIGDQRVIETSVDAEATADAQGADENVSSASVSTGDALASGQAWTDGGAAALVDTFGAERYALQAQLHANATSRAGGSGETTETVDAGQPMAQGQAEGRSGAALLVDAGGSDTYERSPGSVEASDDRCWSHSGAAHDRDAGLGIDLLSEIVGGLAIPQGCAPPPS